MVEAEVAGNGEMGCMVRAFGDASLGMTISRAMVEFDFRFLVLAWAILAKGEPVVDVGMVQP